MARKLYRRGWMEGTGGNLSLREGSTIFITASGRAKGSLLTGDILEIPLTGDFPDSGELRPSAETAIHRALYGIFPETGAVLHVHTPEAVAVSEWEEARLPLPPLEVLKGMGVADPSTLPTIPIFDNDLSVVNIARKIEERLGGEKTQLPVLLIRHHGSTVWGRTLEEAHRHLELAEFCFRVMVTRGRRSR